jgi:hypothetical protein
MNNFDQIGSFFLCRMLLSQGYVSHHVGRVVFLSSRQSHFNQERSATPHTLCIDEWQTKRRGLKYY